MKKIFTKEEKRLFAAYKELLERSRNLTKETGVLIRADLSINAVGGDASYAKDLANEFESIKKEVLG